MSTAFLNSKLYLVIKKIYNFLKPGKLKPTTRLIYNISNLPMIITFRGIESTCEVIVISPVESLIFREPVYLHNDNRLQV